MSAEFDKFSKEYENLVTDPVRTTFGGGSSEFFHTRKMELLLRFLKRRGMQPSEMSWLDVGCGQGELLRLASGYFRQSYGCDVSEGMLSAARHGIEVRPQIA